MNTDTGQVYRIGEDLTGARLELERFQQVAEERELTDDEKAAMRDLTRGDTIVAVSERVAQQALVGGRELERRRRRNKAAKASRKANR